MNSKHPLKERLKHLALTNGFSAFGVSSATSLDRPHPDRFRQWLELGCHAGMEYLTRNIEKRFDASLLMEGARSVIILAKPYGNASLAKENRSGIAMYAWGEDYHRHMRSSAHPLSDLLHSHDPRSQSRFFTDSAPLSERGYAVMAGVGSIGKNGTLITQDYGSMVWLAAIVTSIQLDPDTPATHDVCGSCTGCIQACPTAAIVAPGLVDARQCIAYHNNSSKNPIPDEIVKNLNGFIFGCDICQRVCPHNNQSGGAAESSLILPKFPENWPDHPSAWHDKDENWFRETFSGSAIEPAGFSRLHLQARLACQSDEESSAQPTVGN